MQHTALPPPDPAARGAAHDAHISSTYQACVDRVATREENEKTTSLARLTGQMQIKDGVLPERVLHGTCPWGKKGGCEAQHEPCRTGYIQSQNKEPPPPKFDQEGWSQQKRKGGGESRKQGGGDSKKPAAAAETASPRRRTSPRLDAAKRTATAGAWRQVSNPIVAPAHVPPAPRLRLDGLIAAETGMQVPDEADAAMGDPPERAQAAERSEEVERPRKRQSPDVRRAPILGDTACKVQLPSVTAYGEAKEIASSRWGLAEDLPTLGQGEVLTTEEIHVQARSITERARGWDTWTRAPTRGQRTRTRTSPTRGDVRVQAVRGEMVGAYRG